MENDISFGLARGKVVVRPYSEKWKKYYQRVRNEIKKEFGEKILGIEHVGSTAIIEISAKPIIDLMIAVSDMNFYEEYIEGFEKLGFEFWRDNRKEQGHVLFVKGSEDRRTHYLKLTELDTDFWKEHVFFRDYLNQHPDALKKYENLKKDLSIRYASNREEYTKAKGEFIQGILGKM